MTDMPQLPEPGITARQCDSTMRYTTVYAFSGGQMHAYARDYAAALQAEVEGLRADLHRWGAIHEEVHRRADKQSCLADQCDFTVTISHEDYAAIAKGKQS